MFGAKKLDRGVILLYFVLLVWGIRCPTPAPPRPPPPPPPPAAAPVASTAAAPPHAAASPGCAPRPPKTPNALVLADSRRAFNGSTPAHPRLPA